VRHRSRPFAALSLAADAGALIGANVPGTASVTATITGLRNDKGVVRACLTDDPGDFPKCREDATSHRIVARAAGTLTIEFTNIAPGRHAIALVHDENDNGRIDRALMMIPREGFGFSRDAKVVMGPPSFAAAAFETDGKPAPRATRRRYML